MSITAGQSIRADDFVSTSSGAGDSGKVAKLNAAGKQYREFIRNAFGGSGADGALSISSGTTTLSLGSARYFEKNYTSISITGTGALGFSSPHTEGTIVFLKSQGNVTITSSATRAIDMRQIGSIDGPGSRIATSALLVGSSPVTSTGVIVEDGNRSTSSGVAAQGGVTFFGNSSFIVNSRHYNLAVGGAGCGSSRSTSGFQSPCSGGAGVGGPGTDSSTALGSASNLSAVANVGGGGCLVIECGGALNFTGTIDVGGTNGTNYTPATNQFQGGGSGGGMFLCLYETLTANSGTVTVAGGIGGPGGTGTAGDGGVGFSYIGPNLNHV